MKIDQGMRNQGLSKTSMKKGNQSANMPKSL
jgi:hypothetical protein